MARKTKKQVIRRTSKIADEKHIGTEITDWKSVNDYDNAIYQTLRHYAYYYDKADYVKWTREWVKKTRTDKEYKLFCKAEDWRISPTVAGLCRMIWNGLEIDKHRMKWLNDRVDDVIDAGSRIVEDVSDTTTRKNPAQLVQDKVSEFISEVEEVVDNVTTSKVKKVDVEAWSVFDEMKKAEMPAQTAHALVKYYTPIRDEWKELVEKKSPDLEEAYSNVSTRQRNTILKFFQRLLDDCQLYLNNKKAVRKPRKKKEVPVSKIVSAVKYLPESKEYKIASVAPEKLVGADTIFVFNTKYKRVQIYIAQSKDGMSVKGTTLLGYDPEASTSKTLRKPEEFFQATAKTTKARSVKIVQELKTKDGPVNGRINGDCIIYKVW